MNEARQRLADIAKDPARYATLLEGLVLQVNYRVGFSCVFLAKKPYKLNADCVKLHVLLRFQGFYQLLEPKVTVRCRQEDLEMVQVRVELN